MLGKSSPIAELVDKVVVVSSPQHFYEFDDIEVVDLGENSDLVVGEFAQFGSVFELFYVHDFDCKESLGLAVLSLVDISILTLSDLLDQHVVFDNFVHKTVIVSMK